MVYIHAALVHGYRGTAQPPCLRSVFWWYSCVTLVELIPMTYYSVPFRQFCLFHVSRGRPHITMQGPLFHAGCMRHIYRVYLTVFSTFTFPEATVVLGQFTYTEAVTCGTFLVQWQCSDDVAVDVSPPVTPVTQQCALLVHSWWHGILLFDGIFIMWILLLYFWACILKDEPSTSNSIIIYI